ncbi:MAG: GNAT family N-acetyltransferase [Pseudomonadota bacterium]
MSAGGHAAREPEAPDAASAFDAAWRRLAAEAPGATAFATPDFQRALHAAFGAAGPLPIWMAGPPCAPRALMPARLTARRIGPLAWREAGFPRDAHTLRNHLLGAHEAALAEMIAASGPGRAWDEMFLENLPDMPETRAAVAGAARRLGLALDGPEAGRVLERADLADGWADYLASRSGELRRQLRKRRRGMEARGVVRIRRLAGEALEGEGLAAMRALAGRSWQGRALDPARAARERDFDARLARSAIAGELWLLELDGRPAAAVRLLADARARYVHRMMYDPALADAAPGVVLFGAMLEAIAESGPARVDFNGASRFFHRWATGAATHVHYRLRANGVRGRALGLARAARRAAAGAMG